MKIALEGKLEWILLNVLSGTVMELVGVNCVVRDGPKKPWKISRHVTSMTAISTYALNIRRILPVKSWLLLLLLAPGAALASNT